MQNLLEVHSARKVYESFTLDDVSLNLPAGTIMGLIGPNGAGKTTLIKMILDVVHGDGGTIEVLGSDSRWPDRSVFRKVGFVEDEPTLYGHLSLTGMKSVIAAFYPDWEEPAFQRLADRFELPLSKHVRKLSRGMTTKFALALALSHRAELIVLDEPTTGLDPASRRELLTILAEYIEDGSRSVLFSTHITSDLERVADSITLLQAGRVVFSKEKVEIDSNWALVRGDLSLLDEASRRHLEGWRTGEHGFEALTSRAPDAASHFAGEVLIERASLEDIMFYTSPRHGGRECSH